MSSIYTVRPWVVSVRMAHADTTGIYYPYRTYREWSAVATYNDGTTRVLGKWCDGPGYPRHGGTGRGAAYLACLVAAGWSKASDREVSRVLSACPVGSLEYERAAGAPANPHSIPTGRDRMRRLGIRPDVAIRKDMSARERYRVEYRKARLSERYPGAFGPSGVALHRAARAMVPRYRAISWGSDDRNTPFGADIGGYDVFRYARNKRAERVPYVSSVTQTAIDYARRGDRRFVESYRRHIAHVRSWWRRLPDPDVKAMHYGDAIARAQSAR